MSPPKLIEVGKLLKEKGLKGELKLLPFTDDLEKFKEYRYFFIKGRKREVEYFKNSGRFLSIKIKGIESVEEASKYKNSSLMLHRDYLADEGVLIQDYLNLKVIDKTSKKEIGVVSAYLEAGTNSLFQITLSNKTTKLIPANLDFFSHPDFETNSVYLKNHQALL